MRFKEAITSVAEELDMTLDELEREVQFRFEGGYVQEDDLEWIAGIWEDVSAKMHGKAKELEVCPTT